MEMIRTFVAVELDGAMKRGLTQVQDVLKRAPAGRLVRWVAPTGIHLTLKFLGDVSSDRIAELTEALKRACRSSMPFQVGLTQAGFFPDAHRLRVVWVGVGGEVENLLRLQRAVEDELNAVGFRPEGRGFQPHLTLGRVRDFARAAEREELAKRIAATQVDTNVAMLVREVHLIRSDLRPTGAEYTMLATVSLK
jgi:2'-5' RNA ligase